MAQHYKQRALITLERKRTNCEGLAATSVLLAMDLIEKEPYRQIEVQICQLDNWGHMFVRLSHPGLPRGLFYDPWYQRCKTDTPTMPLLFEEPDFNSKMNYIVQNSAFWPIILISHTQYVFAYNVDSRRLTSVKTNVEYDYKFSILSGSSSFANLAKVKTDAPVIEPGCWGFSCKSM